MHIEYRYAESISNMDSARTGLAVLIVSLLAGCLCAVPAVAAGHRKITISPAQGTLDASPDTQISILGVRPGHVQSVRATGDESGRHPGSLRRYSNKQGASFIPLQPFAEGEHVDVVVHIDGHKPIHRTFGIAHLGRIQPPLKLDKTQPDKLQHFVSEPGLTPPRVSVSKRGTTKGRVFMTPLPSPVVHPGTTTNAITIDPVGPGGPMIVDGNGNLVWFKQLARPDVAANLRIQRYRHHPVLTWWQGGVTPAAYGLGEGVIANPSYRTIATVHAGNGYQMDIHEFTLAPGGSALFTIYSPVMIHLPGTPQDELSPMLDAIVQQVDVDTGLVMWEWHSYGHVPLSQSYATPENSASYDAYHINSIQRLRAGRVLVSMRDTSAVYKIDKASGRILWRLGGKASDFKNRRGARFWFQHDAELLGHGRLSLFDDEAGPPQKAAASRGLILKLNRKHHTARMVHEYLRSKHTSAQSEGSVQTRPRGNVFVGFGPTRFFSQFSSGGRLLYDAALPKDDGSYRMYRYRWNATPRARPAVAARRSGGQVTVHASWNGATDVARWEVLAGPDGGSLRPVGSAPSAGFETKVRVSSSATAFAVRALDSEGHVLATSARTDPS
jgi:hypothetical protein